MGVAGGLGNGAQKAIEEIDVADGLGALYGRQESYGGNNVGWWPRGSAKGPKKAIEEIHAPQ